MKHFTIIREEQFSSIGSKITLLEHRETKARVCFIQNKEENKVFSITFKTPPLSDNGVAHILEHCVLNGSKKYPLKDPFIQLSKNSLNTFLNAMTFPDKTMYPVASCNLKDFHNLTDVYLDAVFHPNIYHNPFIFEQEGWHYELFNEEDDITFKGVVFNEMKGAFSTPEELLHRNIQSALFPNHPYGFDSGGIPENIPELSYEEFIEFHRSHYHPSNSYIYFYGDLDMETELSRLQEYLKEFQYQKPNSDIPPVSKWTEPKEYPMQYPVLDGDSGEEQGYLSLNYAFPFLSIEEKMAMSILAYLLLDAPGAILKERLVNAGMGEEVYGFFSSEIREYTFTIIAKNINIEKKESFLELVKSTLKEVIKEGLDKEKVLAAVNYFEFRLREADFGSYPKGIIYNMSMLEYWIHDKDPLALFDYDKHLNAVREMASGGEIFQLLQTYLLDNPHCAYIIMTPSTSMLSEMEEKERLKLRRHKDSLDLKSIYDLIERNRQLQQIQMTPDSPEVLAMLPSLELTDIEVDGKEVEYREEIVNTAKILHHTANTSGIIYAKMFFECNWLSEEELPLLSLITSYLTMVCSKNYHYSELSDLINRYTGGVGSSLSFYVNKDNCDDFRVGFELKGKAFISAFEKLLEILKEIIAMPKFEDAERLGILIKESASQMQAGLVSGGHITALTRVRSYYSGLASCEERTNGIEFLNS